MTGRLDGKVAVITGSTSGIGAATAQRFHEEGAKVVISGRNRGKGAELAAALGANAAFRAADVVKEEDVANLIAFAIDRFGRLDVLFNNAGDSTAGRAIEDIDTAAFHYDMNLLVGGVLFGMKHAMPHMRRQKSGSIINNASIAGHRHGYGPHVYNAAKAAVAHLTRSVALEVAEHNVRVNAISPGLIVTPIFLNAEQRSPANVDRGLTALATQFARSQALPTTGMPVDIANAALYLASDESRFVTAHDLVVDGGMIAGRTMAEQHAWWARMNETFAAT
ncbi:MAG: glucose 1-dehydrogenase [Alphaproteobacteria bacterium]|nr:glucose 1-dehydrogenase [Alphaproteobacteria bacterium]